MAVSKYIYIYIYIYIYMAVSNLGRKPDCSARRIGPVSVFESIGSIGSVESIESIGSIVHTGKNEQRKRKRRRSLKIEVLMAKYNLNCRF